MGTRADFYVGRGEQAEWIGSIGWDGYPNDGTVALCKATTEAEFRAAVTEFFETEHKDDTTLPADGWPWPWNNSQTTDYSYAFDGGKVWVSNFGHPWYDPFETNENDEEVQIPDRTAKVAFPDMTERKNVTFGNRSGLMIFTKND